MSFDMFESVSLDKVVSIDLKEKMNSLRSGCESRFTPEYGAFLNLPDNFDNNVTNWLGIDVATDISALRTKIMDSAQKMYNGIQYEDGSSTLGLKQISEWKINKDYKEQNIKQHAGYAAEVIGTTKENLVSEKNGTGIKTYRADDRPDLFSKNDQYVDKIRVDSTGKIEKVQVKFVGKDASECLNKLTQKKFDKYFNDGKVDKIEVPKDFYDGMKQQITEKINGLKEQLDAVQKKGKVEVAKKIEAQIDRYEKIDQMLEKSTVTSDEAIEAVKHPKRYTQKLFAKDTFAESHKAGMESAAFAVAITAAVSTIDDVSKVIDGEMTAQEAFVDVAKDVGISGGLAYGTTFISTAVANTMSASSHNLIQALGKSGVPAAVISFGVQSFDSVVDYANGTIDGKQLAYDLGENAAMVGGSAAGAAIAGAVVGSVVPGAGTAVGFCAGLVGGTIGCAIASEAYASAVTFGVDHAEVFAEKAQEMANKTVEIASEVVPEKVSNIIASINSFAVENHVPIQI